MRQHGTQVVVQHCPVEAVAPPTDVHGVVQEWLHPHEPVLVAPATAPFTTLTDEQFRQPAA